MEVEYQYDLTALVKALPYYPPGAIIARRYEVIKSLGKGGAGSVYLCRELKKPDNLIAIKILSSQLSDDPTLLARFYREGKISSQIKSPYVVKSYDLVMDDGLFAYTMEYVAGRDLGDILEENPKPAIEFTCAVIKDIAQGLVEIHKHNVIHRDLKPSNVIVKSDNLSKITDFGVVHLAKVMHAKHEVLQNPQNNLQLSDKNNNSKSDKLTLMGDIVGTIDYISPEYVYKLYLDERSDIYSYGVLAYQMLVGRVPFDGETTHQRLKARIEQSPQDIKNFRNDIPTMLSQMIMACLERSPKKRPQTAAEVYDVLCKL